MWLTEDAVLSLLELSADGCVGVQLVAEFPPQASYIRDACITWCVGSTLENFERARGVVGGPKLVSFLSHSVDVSSPEWTWLITKGLTGLEINGCESLTSFYRPLADQLRRVCPMLRAINIFNVCWQDIDALLSVFSSPMLSMLSMSNISDGGCVINKVLQCIASRCLVSVSFSGMSLDDGDLRVLCALLDPCCLEVLDVSRTWISDLSPLLPLLVPESCLRILDVSFNAFETSTDLIRAAMGANRLERLVVLDGCSNNPPTVNWNYEEVWCHPSLVSLEVGLEWRAHTFGDLTAYERETALLRELLAVKCATICRALTPFRNSSMCRLPPDLRKEIYRLFH